MVVYKDYWKEDLIVNDGLMVYPPFKENATLAERKVIGKHHAQLRFKLKLYPTAKPGNNIDITYDTNVADLLFKYTDIVSKTSYSY